MTAKIVVIGGGFAGLRIARLIDGRLRPSEAVVSLIDGSPYHTLRPKLPQAVGGRIPCAVHLPFKHLLRDTRVQFIQGLVTGIDAGSRRVSLASDDKSAPDVLDADAIVIATGGEAHPEVRVEPGATLLSAWNFDQACNIRRRVGFLSQAAILRKPANASVVVIGGGFVGVELAAEVQSRLNRLGVSKLGSKTTLIERSPSILSRLGERAASQATRRLGALGVEVLTSKEVVEVNREGVSFADGDQMNAGTIVWAGGVAFASRIEGMTMLDSSGRIPVDRQLQVVGYPGLYAVGDCASLANDDAVANEASAHRALQQAGIAARNVLAQLRGGTFSSYRVKPNVYLLGLGPGYGLLLNSSGKRTLSGWLPSLIKEGVMLRYLWGIGGAGCVLHTLKPVIASAFTRNAWDGEPLPEGNVLH